MILWFWIWASIFFKTSNFSKKSGDISISVQYMPLTSIILKIVLLIFFHEKYHGLNVALSNFRSSEKYCQYRDNHWKQGWWEDKQRKLTTVTTGSGKKKKNIIYLKTFGAQWNKIPGHRYHACGIVFYLWHSFVTY